MVPKHRQPPIRVGAPVTLRGATSAGAAAAARSAAARPCRRRAGCGQLATSRSNSITLVRRVGRVAPPIRDGTARTGVAVSGLQAILIDRRG